MKRLSRLAACGAGVVVLGLASCGPEDSSRAPGAGGSPGVGGVTASGGGLSGGAPATGGASGGLPVSGGAGSGGGSMGGGGTVTGGYAGTGGAASGSGGSGGAPRQSDDPEIAAAIAAQDRACRAACEQAAMPCQPVVYETIDNCLGQFGCLSVKENIDLQDLPKETVLACLTAGATHMNCVSQLDCEAYYGWWNENIDPFPCQTEQYAEEAVCDRTFIFLY